MNNSSEKYALLLDISQKMSEEIDIAIVENFKAILDLYKITKKEEGIDPELLAKIASQTTWAAIRVIPIMRISKDEQALEELHNLIKETGTQVASYYATKGIIAGIFTA